MRIIFLIGIALTWAAAYASADDQIKLPRTPVLIQPDDTPVPLSEIIGSLSADQFYVVESNTELITLTSPEGFVDIEASTGPIKVRARFVDGADKIETRTYSSPFVYFVTAKAAGTTELLLIPHGVTSQDDIVRQVLTVSGVGPNPPPEPIPPDPPQPVKSFRVIFVKESGSTLSAEQSAIPGAKAIRDYLTAKTTPEGGLAGWREYDPQQSTANEQPTMKALWAAVQPKIQAVPCMVIEVNGKATVMAFPANVADAIETLKKAGG